MASLAAQAAQAKRREQSLIQQPGEWLHNSGPSVLEAYSHSRWGGLHSKTKTADATYAGWDVGVCMYT